MAFVTAIKTDVRNEIIRILQQDIVFLVSPNDVNLTIAPTAVVFQKSRAQINRLDVQENQLTDMPGLIVSQPKRMGIPLGEGEVAHDWWQYHYLIQLVDRDMWDSDDRIQSWDKWIEQIASKFMDPCALGNAFSLPKGQLMIGFVAVIEDVDQVRWVRESNFIMGVEVEVIVSQVRGTVL